MMTRLFTKTVLILAIFTVSEANPKCDFLGQFELEYRTLHTRNEFCSSCISFNMNSRTLARILCTDDTDYHNGDVLIENLFSYLHEFNYQFSYLGLTISSANCTSYVKNDRSSWINEKINLLDISKNDIRILPSSFFFSFPRLLELDISRNNLTSISSEMFRHLSELQKLDLSRNSISHMADPFKHIIELFDLDLSHNKISYISKDLFESQTHLENLNLSYNEMVHFDVHLQNYPHFFFDYLDLSFNKLENVSINMNIKRITISHNNLVAFSLNLSETLVFLNLSHNNLEKISNYTMLNAVNIEQIDLSNNRLQYLPTASFRNQKQLKSLDISHNLFATSTFGPENNWPTFFLNFEALRTANLDNNLWKCAELKEITYILKARSVKVAEGTDHSSNNILGIKCFVYDKNNSNILGSKVEASQELGNEILNEILEFMLPKFKNLELQFNDTRNKMNEDIFNRSLIEPKSNKTEQNLTELFTRLTNYSKQINSTIANLENFKSNINKSVAVDIQNLNQVVSNILLKFENLQKHINGTHKYQQNIETSTDANSEIANKVLAEVLSRLENSSLPMKQKAFEPNAKSSISDAEDGNKLIPKADRQILASETLLKKISEGTNAISGMVIQNLLLLSVLLAMLYIMFVTIKTKRQIASRDELNLVQP